MVVLIYHRVGRRTSQSVDLPVEQFDEQMAELAASGRVITLDRAVDVLSGLAPAPTLQPDPVVITFDDGTADLADLATPVLERHRVPATLYVATDFVDRSLPFPDDGVALSWSALADMAATGLWQIGSHTHTHALLDRLADDQIADELDRSIDLIGEHLGRAPAHFAYPKALPPSRGRRPARCGPASARPPWPAPGSTASAATDPWRLARTPIQVDDGPRWFRRKALGGMAFEDDLRRIVNRRPLRLCPHLTRWQSDGQRWGTERTSSTMRSISSSVSELPLGRHRPRSKIRSATAPPTDRAVGEDRLAVQRLPRRTGLDVVGLEGAADVVGGGAEHARGRSGRRSASSSARRPDRRA